MRYGVVKPIWLSLCVVGAAGLGAGLKASQASPGAVFEEIRLPGQIAQVCPDLGDPACLGTGADRSPQETKFRDVFFTWTGDMAGWREMTTENTRAAPAATDLPKLRPTPRP